MENAYDKAVNRLSLTTPWSHTRAVEIRAVADWIEQWQIEVYSVVLRDVVEVLSLLREEADRAERGE